MTLAEKIIHSLGCRLRRKIPNPKVTAILFGTEAPSSYIKGSRTGLLRPETNIFSPSGDLMAVSNSLTDSITLYAKDDAQAYHYADNPVGMIRDTQLIGFPHDAAFTPDGKYLLVAGREMHTIAMYALNQMEQGNITSQLLWSLTGDEYSICFPSGIRIHPSGKVMAIANRKKYGLTLYHGTGSNGEFDTKPFQMISEDDLYNEGQATAHGIDFSPDGKYLALVHRTFYQNMDSKGEAGLSIYAMQDDPEQGINPEPLCFVPYEYESLLHFVAFNPTGDIVALVVAASSVDFFSWQPERKTLEKIGTIEIYNARFGEGPKGVAFTKDGKQIAVTTEFNEVLFYDVDPYITVDEAA